jgi:ribosomal protein S14
MLSSKIKDLKLRQQFFLSEKKLKINKFLTCHLLTYPIKTSNKLILYPLLAKISKTQRLSKTKLSNRCINSNRGKGILRSYSLSRIVMREYLQFGVIPGFRKSVW